MRRLLEWGWLAAVLTMGVDGLQAKVRMIIVAPSGGEFSTIQAAVNAAPDAGAVLMIRPGVYREVVHVDKSNIQFRGILTIRRRWCWCMGTTRLRRAGRRVRRRCL